MAHIILPERTRRQPSGIVEVNDAHPLRRKLFAAWCATVPHRELVQGSALSLVGSPPLTGTVGGMVWKQTGSSVGAGAMPTHATTPDIYERDYGEFSISAHCIQTTENSIYSGIDRPNGGAGGSSWQVGIRGGSTDGPVCALWITGGTSQTSPTPAAGEIDSTKPNFVTMTALASTVHLWCNKSIVKPDVISRGVGAIYYDLAVSTSRRVFFGGYGGTHNGTLCSFIWDKPLTLAEHQALAENPWQLFRRSTPKTYFFPPQRPEPPPAVIIPRHRQGVRSPALDFTGGSSNRVEVGTWNLNRADATLAVWCYMDSFNASRDDRWISKADGTGTANHDFMLGKTGTTPIMRARWNRNSTTALGLTTLPTGRWFHVASSFHGRWNATYARVRLWFDGREDGSASYDASWATTTSISNNANLVYVGNQPTATTNAPDGRLRWPAIWERALSPGEIRALAFGASPLDFPDRLVYFGGEVRGGKLIDLSGRARHGDIIGATSYAAQPLQLVERRVIDPTRTYFYPKPMQPSLTWGMVRRRPRP